MENDAVRPIRPNFLLKSGAVVDSQINQPGDAPADFGEQGREISQVIARAGVVENVLVGPRKEAANKVVL